MNYRTDLALEQMESKANTELQGIKSSQQTLEHDIVRFDVEVLNEQGAETIGKPVGKYITIEAKAVADRDLDVQQYAGTVVADCLKNLIDEVVPFPGKRIVTLVVGLGNRGMTADALGPMCVDNVIVTRHIYELIQKELDQRLQSVCALTPGVLGVTGIESFDIIKGVTDKIKPDVVVVVDSLASRKTDRIATTYQLTNTGIVPGGGLQNARLELSKATLGVPVIAIGVPMVVYASTIAHDVIDELANDATAFFAPKADSVEMAVRHTVSEVVGDLVVTPKDIDSIVEDAAFVIATGLNLALHRELSVEDAMSYMH